MKSRNILFFQYPWRLWRERLAGIYRYAKGAGWRVSVAEYGRNFDSISDALKFWSPDGIIVEGSYTELEDFSQSAFKGVPAVFCDAAHGSQNMPCYTPYQTRHLGGVSRLVRRNRPLRPLPRSAPCGPFGVRATRSGNLTISSQANIKRLP